MSAVEILRQARELIADKSRWTQGHYARDGQGRLSWSTDPGAVCWCALGALNRCKPSRGSLAGVSAGSLLDRASYRLFGADIAQVNDGDADLGNQDPHAAIIMVYDAAIVDAEAANA